MEGGRAGLRNQSPECPLVMGLDGFFFWNAERRRPGKGAVSLGVLFPVLRLNARVFTLIHVPGQVFHFSFGKGLSLSSCVAQACLHLAIFLPWSPSQYGLPECPSVPTFVSFATGFH